MTASRACAQELLRAVSEASQFLQPRLSRTPVNYEGTKIAKTHEVF
jgi:hypothetical protein